VLTQKLLKQGYVAPQLKSVVQRMYGRYHERVYSYTLFISQKGEVMTVAVEFGHLSFSVVDFKFETCW
jgi:hypothetical protein